MSRETEHEKISRQSRELASLLGETERGPLTTIQNIIYHLGWYFAREMYIRAIEVQVGGGMLLPDGSRKRTLGGVFFQVVRQELTQAERDFFFPDWRERRARRATALAADPLKAAAASARKDANIAKDQALKAAAAERKAARAAARTQSKAAPQKPSKPAQSVPATPASAPLSEKMQAAKAKAAAALLEHQTAAAAPALTPEQAAAALAQWTASKRKPK